MARPDHIFIVGMGRTGSTLTRRILNSSSEVGIGGESHFLRNLPRIGFRAQRSFRQTLAGVGDLSSETGARQVVDYIFSDHGRHYNFWNFRAKQIDRQEFLCRLLESDRSDRALFDLAMAIHAGEKPIRGEKTPAHIYNVPLLLEWFPNARIIHTFRDPRAIYISSRRKAAQRGVPLRSAILRKSGMLFDLYASLHLIVVWRKIIDFHRRYARDYPCHYYLLKYEDLVSNPKHSLQNLCDFLEIPFTDAMLQQTVINSSYRADGEIEGFDTSAIDRWRRHLHPLINRWFILWCRHDLLEFGYQP